MENPFYITGVIPEPYFCDREKETTRIERTLENKAHILLTSLRRMGKTQLIRHVFEQSAIKDTSWQRIIASITESRSLLQAVFNGDSDTVARGVDLAHDEKPSILSYNDENSLACVLAIAFHYAKTTIPSIGNSPRGKALPTLC